MHESHGAAVTVLTARLDDPKGYGRIIRDADGAFTGIVEEADASPEQRAITEINSGMYAFDGDLLADTVKRVPTDNAKGEEYLTDVVSILRGDGYPVATVACADPQEVLGVNDQAQLAWARRVLNERLLGDWMSAGVTIVDPASTWIDVGVTLEPGCTSARAPSSRAAPRSRRGRGSGPAACCGTPRSPTAPRWSTRSANRR